MSAPLKQFLARPVSELSKGHKVHQCAPNTSLYDAIHTLQQNNIGSLVIMDGPVLRGVFTERDLIMKLSEKPLDLKKETVGSFMTEGPATALKHDSLGKVLKKMRDKNFRHMIIVDNYGHVQSVISQKDITQYIIDELGLWEE